MHPEISPRRLIAPLLLSLLLVPAHAQDDTGGDQAPEDVKLEDLDIDESEVSQEDLKKDKIDVDERIFRQDWNEVPFDTSYFSYTDEQIKKKWPGLMEGLRAPYPDVELIKYAIDNYPGLTEGIDEQLLNNPEQLHEKAMEVWSLFFSGEFQEAREKGLKLGPLGMMPGAFSQTYYAMYLADRKSTKDMLLQDIINTVNSFDGAIQRMKNDDREDIRKLAAFAILGKAYALARIAEESPVPVAVARGYIRKVKELANEVLDLVPDHPLGHAFLAGVDSGIMRRVGKFTGRMTYGARTTVVKDAFETALEKAPGYAIVQYEYANSLIYMNRKRELNTAMRHLEKATKLQPAMAMEALDSMYAYKRLQEIRLYALNYRSWRDFEEDRFGYMRATDRNLTSVLHKPLSMDKLKNPKKYDLGER
jgi:tetratricopeptide (TPR) repeat protein